MDQVGLTINAQEKQLHSHLRGKYRAKKAQELPSTEPVVEKFYKKLEVWSLNTRKSSTFF